MKEEVWKDIEGFEGFYQISNHGRLKSFKKARDGYVMSNKDKNGWYLTVVLKNGNLRVSEKMHRLVANAFIPNPGNKLCVNHIDCNKQNNHVNNLEWVTFKENRAHVTLNNPDSTKAMNNYNRYVRPKTINQFSLNGELLNEFANARIAFECTGVCSRNILQVANKSEYKQGKTRKQAGGFVWKFKEEGE